ncbi:MAG: hypothetical protein JJE51_14910 [Thermoanaerobaculia bacterium]|nr:hypothetical protein [Thermoanaerobaculia bacterium]
MVERNGEVHRFLHDEIASEEALDVVVLLYRHRAQSWSAEEIRDRLRLANDASASMASIATKRIELRLAHLQQKRMARVGPGNTFRYEPGDAQIDRRVAGLAAMNDTDLAAAAGMIYLRPRSGPDAFADAFGPGKR